MLHTPLLKTLSRLAAAMAILLAISSPGLPQTVAPAKPAAAAHSAPGRAEFIRQLKTAFMRDGNTLAISEQTTPDPGAAGMGASLPVPALVIMGALDEQFVYRMLTTKSILQGAAKAGFKGVDIRSTLSRVRYIYDLSHGVPKCDTGSRICL